MDTCTCLFCRSNTGNYFLTETPAECCSYLRLTLPYKEFLNITENGSDSKAKSLSETEASDVREFLQREQKNGGVLMLMLHFMESLCDRAELSWPQELASVYVKVYTRWRKHVDLPCLLRLDLFSMRFLKAFKCLFLCALLTC